MATKEFMPRGNITNFLLLFPRGATFLPSQREIFYSILKQAQVLPHLPQKTRALTVPHLRGVELVLDTREDWEPVLFMGYTSPGYEFQVLPVQAPSLSLAHTKLLDFSRMKGRRTFEELGFNLAEYNPYQNRHYRLPYPNARYPTLRS